MNLKYGKKDKVRFIATLIEPLDFDKTASHAHEVLLKLIPADQWTQQIRANTPIVTMVGNALVDFKGAEAEDGAVLEFSDELKKAVCDVPFIVNGLWKYLAALQNGVGTDKVTAELLGNSNG